MRYFLCMLLIVWNAGCTTMRTVENPEPAMAVSQLAIGDKVEVITVDGRKLRFKVLAIDDEQVTGEVIKPGQIATDDRVSVPIDEIRLVSRAEFDGVKTAAAGVGGAVLVAALAVAFFILTFSIY
jgi:hypothetical protein